MLKTWLLNISLAIATIIAVLWLIFVGLKWYTRHDVAIVVPNIKGQEIADAALKLEEADLRYEIHDSVYNEDFKRNAVTEQDPPAGSKVKPNRIIYLSVNALGKPKVKMPKLVDQSFSLAQALLKNLGFKLGHVEYRPDDIGDNLVIEQLHNNIPVPPGRLLDKGSVIDLVVATNSRGRATPADSSSGEPDPELGE